ncbi:MAG: DUF2267 domain-containing protein [Sandaracinaceae bacterium]
MDEAQLHEQIRAHTGEDAHGVERILVAAAAALGTCIGAGHRRALVAELPEAARSPFLDARYDPDVRLPQLVARMAEQEQVAEGRAIEHISAAVSVWASLLADDLRRILERELPDDVAAWARSSPEHAPRRARAAHGQAGSVVDPRPGRKLSTAQGLTQERAHRSLAEGHPGSDAPVSMAEGLTQEREHHTLADAGSGPDETG